MAHTRLAVSMLYSVTKNTVSCRQWSSRLLCHENPKILHFESRHNKPNYRDKAATYEIWFYKKLNGMYGAGCRHVSSER